MLPVWACGTIYDLNHYLLVRNSELFWKNSVDPSCPWFAMGGCGELMTVFCVVSCEVLYDGVTLYFDNQMDVTVQVFEHGEHCVLTTTAPCTVVALRVVRYSNAAAGPP